MRPYQRAKTRIKLVDTVIKQKEFQQQQERKEYVKNQKGRFNIHEVINNLPSENNVIHWSSKSQNFKPTSIIGGMLNLIKVTGQRPIVTTSRIGVARLGLREGGLVGCKVTIRNKVNVTR